MNFFFNCEISLTCHIFIDSPHFLNRASDACSAPRTTVCLAWSGPSSWGNAKTTTLNCWSWSLNMAVSKHSAGLWHDQQQMRFADISFVIYLSFFTLWVQVPPMSAVTRISRPPIDCICKSCKTAFNSKIAAWILLRGATSKYLALPVRRDSWNSLKVNFVS